MGWVVKIYVEKLSDFEDFVEYIFRILGKVVIAYVGIVCDWFEELKEINVMIPEIKEKMWEEVDRFGHLGLVCAKPEDYKLTELLFYYDYLYNDDFKKDEGDEESYEENIKDKISEYRGINNEKPYHNDYFVIYD
jgi:hypothetical protein